MYELPPQLTGAHVAALRENLRAALELRDEISGATASGRYSMSGYVALVHQLLLAVGHGERDRYAAPQLKALQRLEELQEKDNATLDRQFSTTRTKLVAALNLYCKGLQRGFLAHEQETASTPPDSERPGHR